ncbi:hypothetical protein RI129_006521 [Pyrocoelia pectoralis]|uniref:Serpin domain-containing protein n=1 Tax=Pyrocoelia pectoralis TaxID=417401 RepID=A0AAN7VGK3_9COLE
MKLAVSVVFIFLITTTTQNQLRNVQQIERRFGVALEAILGVGIRLQVLLDDPSVDTQRNFLVSPLSITLLISQLMLGADEGFRAELYNLLSLPHNNDHKHAVIKYYGNYGNKTFKVPYAKLHSQMGNLLRELKKNDFTKTFTLNCSSGLFYNAELKLLDTFQHNLHIYETEIQALNFSTDPVTSQKVINSWAAEQTKGVIKTILPLALPKSTAAIFTNAVYFKADWEMPFSYELNMVAPFRTSLQKTVDVEYMQRVFENMYYADNPQLGCKVVKVPYKNDDVAMYFLLPNVQDGKEYNIRKFTENLKAKEILQLLSQLKRSKVALQVPKFKISNSLSILNPLQRYRVFQKLYRTQLKSAQSGDPIDTIETRIDLFNALNTTEKMEIELSEATENQLLKVSNIFQEVSISVDEKGTEAAAITASIIDYIGGTKSVRLDRPFAFIIRHEITSATLFWGTVVDPTQVI